MRLRILIADDESLEKRALSSIISTITAHDIQLVEATNGRQAVELAKTKALDIAFLDIKMPGMDGLMAAHGLRELQPGIHIIFVTAFDHFDYAREALRLGVDEYLVKPAAPDEIRETVLRIAGKIIARDNANSQKESKLDADQMALNLLEEELRSDLARGDIDKNRMSSFLHLKGFDHRKQVAAIIRFSSTRLPDSSLRHKQLRRVMELLDHQLQFSGNYILSGADGEQIRCIFMPAGPESQGTTQSDNLSLIKDALQNVVDKAKTILGLHIVVGACMFPLNDDNLPTGEQLDPFITAKDAVFIAGTGQTVVLLAPVTDPVSLQSNHSHLCQSASTVERAIAYMHQHLSKDISLADVAEAVGTAPSHLSRLFSRHSGDTFTHVLCRLRIQTAKNLLRTNQYRIKEVYTMVGFNDQAYFSRVFRKYEGTSPQEYRGFPE